MTIYDAPELTGAGIDYFAQNAGRLGLETKILTGVVVLGSDPGHMSVICDGDTTPLTMVSTIGQLPPGSQVTILNVGHKGLFIIGSQSKALSNDALPNGGVPGIPPFPPDSGPGGGGFIPGPGTTAPYSTVLVHDTFNRGVITDNWGTPDVGPSYVGESNPPNEFVNVGPGFGELGVVASIDLTPSISVFPGPVGGFIESTLTVRNHSRLVKNIQATVPGTPGIPNGIFALRCIGTGPDQAEPLLNFYGDGTTSIIIIPQIGSPFSPEVFIPGVTSHQPVDIYAKWLRYEVQAWAALTSVGIDFNSPPTVSLPTRNSFSPPGVGITSPTITFFTWHGRQLESSSVTVGEIKVELINWL